MGRIEVLDNGILDPLDWEYSAEIKRVEDVAGDVLTPEQEAQYWTVNESGSYDREYPFVAEHKPLPQYIITSSDPTPNVVREGQQATFTLERFTGNPLESAVIPVRTWEPNRRGPDGDNPSEQIHMITIPAMPMTDLWVDYEPVAITFTVTATDDSDVEDPDYLRARMLDSVDRSPLSGVDAAFLIVGDDYPSVRLSADSTSVTEGDPVAFTLTREGGTTGELTVGVAVDDPGGFLKGNSPSEAVAVPSNVAFAPGETVREITLTPPDDWRDIPNGALTFRVIEDKRKFEIVGPVSLTVQVADNDAAPQDAISFNESEVVEGTDLVLTIERVGDNRNPLKIPVTAGPAGDQQDQVVEIAAGMSAATLTFSLPNNTYKGPDFQYETTLRPGPPEFWTPTGQTTVVGAILDNDLYQVRIIALHQFRDEGQNIYNWVSHNGQIGESLLVNVERSETGNAVADHHLGPHTHTITAGSNRKISGYAAETNDGSDGDAEFTVALLPGDGYVIDPDRASITVTVRDRDPLPAVVFTLEASLVTEGGDPGSSFGEREIDLIWVAADLPSGETLLRDVTVDYEITGDGTDVLDSSGTLEIPAGRYESPIEVRIFQDAIAEENEQFTVVLSNSVNAAFQDGQTTLSQVVNIFDDEPTVSMEAVGPEVTEGRDVVFNLTRSGSIADEFTVWLQVIESAPRNVSSQVTATFPAGQATTELVVATENDYRLLDNYTVTAVLNAAESDDLPPAYHREEPLTAEVTVRDDDLPNVHLILGRHQPGGRVNEGDPVKFWIGRTNTAYNNPLAVPLLISGAPGYTTGQIPTVVTIPAWSDSVQVVIPTEDDDVVEDTGELTIKLLGSDGYLLRHPNTGTFSIFDDDGHLPGVRVSAVEPWVDEGEDVTFTVTRSGSGQDVYSQEPLDARLRL